MRSEFRFTWGCADPILRPRSFFRRGIQLPTQRLWQPLVVVRHAAVDYATNIASKQTLFLCCATVSPHPIRYNLVG